MVSTLAQGVAASALALAPFSPHVAALDTATRTLRLLPLDGSAAVTLAGTVSPAGAATSPLEGACAVVGLRDVQAIVPTGAVANGATSFLLLDAAVGVRAVEVDAGACVRACVQNVCVFFAFGAAGHGRLCERTCLQPAGRATARARLRSTPLRSPLHGPPLVPPHPRHQAPSPPARCGPQ